MTTDSILDELLEIEAVDILRCINVHQEISMSISIDPLIRKANLRAVPFIAILAFGLFANAPLRLMPSCWSDFVAIPPRYLELAQVNQTGRPDQPGQLCRGGTSESPDAGGHGANGSNGEQSGLTGQPGSGPSGGNGGAGSLGGGGRSR